MSWSPSVYAALALTLLLCAGCLWNPCAGDASATTTQTIHAVERGPFTQLVPGSPSTTVGPVVDDVTKRFEEFKRSPLYLPPFEDYLMTIPDVQREFITEMAEKDFDLIRKILKEAIDKRNNFAPSVALMFKYSGKLLSNFIANRRNEQMITPRKEQKAEFFQMMAHTFEHVLDLSAKLKNEKRYTKSTVDTDQLYQRADALMSYMLKVIRASPVSGYLRWNELVVFRNETSNPNHDKDIVEEAGDLVAMFRAMGYDKCMFVARRIINLLNMFSKGMVPSEKEV